MKTTLLSFSLLLLTITFSCTGPAGEPGPAGATGATGAAGPAGPAGPAGSANVLTSAWRTVKATDWVISTTTPQQVRFAFTDNSLTQTVLDRGIVMAFTRTPGQTGVAEPMPFVYTNGSSESFVVRVGTITFLYNANKTLTQADLFATEYRWVIIPTATLSGGRLAGVDWTNYEAVRDYLHLTD